MFLHKKILASYTWPNWTWRKKKEKIFLLGWLILHIRLNIIKMRQIIIEFNQSCRKENIQFTLHRSKKKRGLWDLQKQQNFLRIFENTGALLQARCFSFPPLAPHMQKLLVWTFSSKHPEAKTESRKKTLFSWALELSSLNCCCKESASPKLTNPYFIIMIHRTLIILSTLKLTFKAQAFKSKSPCRHHYSRTAPGVRLWG